MPKTASDTKRKHLEEMVFSLFSPTERLFLKHFHISESTIIDIELQHLLRLLVEPNNVFCKFTYDVGKSTPEINVTLEKDAESR